MSEIMLNETSLLVSQTDEKGIIIYANDDFCNIVGYKVSELIGKPHNLIRHPDMPAAAFKDLWQTIKQGNIWNGFVKNSCKDHSNFYWVFATVFPYTDSDGNKGYLSVRKMANRVEIQRSEELYRSMR